MSFQGDVAGIGLGELLQGLARGGRDGVLTLRGKGLEATLGLSGGQIFLLPEPDENPEIWRKRCERAWVKDPNHRIDSLRMSEIAYAARMETMFQLLDGEGLHFRFEPGAIPAPSDSALVSEEAQLGRAETGSKIEVRVPVHCHGISVEFLLLEYARLTDECRTHGDANLLAVHYVPRLVVQDVPANELERFWSECDGTSNVGEMADRLGWPLRQCKATLVDLSVKGYLVFAHARELLELAQDELDENRFARAASRLAGWCLAAPPGPPALEEAEMLLQEWQRGKLPVVLASMDARAARTLLRRLDHSGHNAGSAVARWKELRQHQRHDTIAELAHVHWRLRSEDEADAPPVNDLLRLARDFQDRGFKARAGVLLHAASLRLPESTTVRLEVGTRLLQVGRVEEGTHWVLEACRAMVEAGHHEKALVPLRNLLLADKSCREARSLFVLARNRSSSGKRTRRLSVVTLSTVLVLSLGAFVKLRSDLDYDRRLNEIQEMSKDPEAALAALDEHFAEDPSQRVAELRASLLLRMRAERDGLRDKWKAIYAEAQQECTSGDERRGLQLALNLPPPPELPGMEDGWQTLSELLDGLGARLEQTLEQFPQIDPEGSQTPAEELGREARFDALIEELRADVVSRERTFTLDAFLQRLDNLRSRIEERDQRRAEATKKRESNELEQHQNRLLDEARAYYAVGDLKRSVARYKELEQVDLGGLLTTRVLVDEITDAKRELAAYESARAMAGQGRHAEAAALIEAEISNPHLYALPCRVVSQPAGARARFADGSIRVTPFTQDVQLREHVEMTFQLAGCEPLKLVLDGPRDADVMLSRLANFTWGEEARVNALPVPVEDGCIVADRAGRIARLGADGRPVWERRLGTLGGIARTPVFLPRRQGTLLAVTEDGSAWLVEVEGGRVEGPWNMESPPAAGPLSTSEGVVVAFNDGKIARWDTRLRPDVLEGPSSLSTEQRNALTATTNGAPGNMAVLRRSANTGTVLQPGWGDWSVEVGETHVVVRHAKEPQRSFPIQLRAAGTWCYVAWEAPTAMRPGGRLWLSDDGGLRGFEP
jgi:hypothetical protein